MCNFYVLTLGKNLKTCDTLRTTESQLQFTTNCYYDWFGLYPAKDNDGKAETATDLLRDIAYETAQEVKNDFLDSGRRVLQTIMLATDEDDSVIKSMLNKPSELSIVYITFVRLNHKFKEAEFSKNSEEEIQIPKNIVDAIKKYDSDGANIGIYRSFDYSDYVIVCNGQTIELNKYMELLKRLRCIPSPSKKSKESEAIICDLTTLYGYIPEQLRLNTENFFGIVKEECFSKEDTKSFSLLGHYDQFYESDKVSLEKLFINNSTQSYSSNQRKIQLGVPCEKLTCFPNADNKHDELLEKANNAYKTYKDLLLKEFKNSILESEHAYFKSYILGTFEEIYQMISSMLNKGVSVYYVLSIYESFFGVLSFIIDKILRADKESLFSDNDQLYIDDKDCARRRLELIFDITNAYFSHLQILTSSMMHDEREVVQADPYQLMCFDMPPKLIAFYTSMAYFMLDVLNKLDKDSEAKYTILLVPNFKSDIFVESLYDNQDYEKEQNILVLHINEKTIYDIPYTLQIIAHEIAHHVGQNRKTRAHRAKLYVKCFIGKICSMIWDLDNKDDKSIKSNLFASINGDINRNSYFNEFVEALFTEWTNADIFPKEYTGNNWFYTDSSIETFIGEILTGLNHPVSRDKMEQGFKAALKGVFENEPSILLSYIPSGADFYQLDNDIETTVSFIEKIKGFEDASNYSIDFIVNLITNAFFHKLTTEVIHEFNSIVIVTGHTQVFETVTYVFREGLSDVNMLHFVYKSEKVVENLNNYKSSLEGESKTVGDNIRSLAVRMSFPEYVKEVNYNDETSAGNAFENYIYDEARKYFESYNEEIEKNQEFKKAAERIQKDVEKVRSAKSSTELFSIIERVIHEYSTMLKNKELINDSTLKPACV